MKNKYGDSRPNEQTRADVKQYYEENDNGEVSPQILLHACKVVLRRKTISYCSNLKKQRKEKVEQLVRIRKIKEYT